MRSLSLLLFLFLLPPMSGVVLAEATPFLLHTMHGDAGAVVSISFSLDGKQLSFGDTTGMLRQYDLDPVAFRASSENSAGYVAYSPIGYPTGEVTMVTANPNGKVDVYYPDDLQLENLVDNAGDVASLSEDGRWLAAGFGDLNVMMWPLYRFVPEMNGIAMPQVPWPQGTTLSLALNRDASRLAQAGTVTDVGGTVQGAMILWDVPVGRIIKAELSGAQVTQVAYSNDGKRVAWVGTGDASAPGAAPAPIPGHIVIYDAHNTQRLTSPPAQPAPVTSVAFSPDGKVLATGAADGKVTLWDAATARQLLVLDGAQGTVQALSFSRDGTLLASGGIDGTVRLWDAKSALASVQ